MSSRAKAIKRNCPKCGAWAGYKCFAADGGRRKAAHRERHVAAKVSNPKLVAAKKNTRGSNLEWAKKRARVFAEKGCLCHYCGGEASHIDHVFPLSRGGTDDFDNLVPCCVACNISKGAMTLEEWKS